MKKDEQTKNCEIVKIRISAKTKKTLQEIADKEYRSFLDQGRLALDEWVENRIKKGSKLQSNS
jgi:hypothetical protein